MSNREVLKSGRRTPALVLLLALFLLVVWGRYDVWRYEIESEWEFDDDRGIATQLGHDRWLQRTCLRFAYDLPFDVALDSDLYDWNCYPTFWQILKGEEWGWWRDSHWNRVE